MRQRSWQMTAWTMAMTLMLPVPALALNVSDMRARAVVGEPLNIELTLSDLRGVQPGDISVDLAWPEDHTRLRVPYPADAGQMRFFVVRDGGGKVIVQVTGPAPVTSTRMSFLVRIVWPGHLLLQQVYASFADPAGVSTTGAASSPPQPAQPVELPTPVTPDNPETAAAPAPAPRVYPPDPAWVPYQPERDPENKPAATAREKPARPVAAVVIPVKPVAAVARRPAPAALPLAANGQVRVRPGDTLSRLAKAWPAPGLSLAQRQQLILESNPQAFIDGDINRLRADVSLNLPAQPEAAAEAAPVWTQSKAPERLSRPVEAAATAQAPAAAAGQGEVTLTLVAPDAGASGQGSGQGADAGAAFDAGQAAAALSAVESRRSALLSERQALLARLDGLKTRSAEQDQRLQLLDARLAAFDGKAGKPAAAKPANAAQAADNQQSRRDAWLWGGLSVLAALLLAVMLVRRRKPEENPLELPRREPVLAAGEAERPAIDDDVLVQAEASWQDSEAAVAAGDDEYDFLTDGEAEAFQTRLDLAQAYIAMNEGNSARGLLQAVEQGGTPEQRRQAGELLKGLA